MPRLLLMLPPPLMLRLPLMLPPPLMPPTKNILVSKYRPDQIFYDLIGLFLGLVLQAWKYHTGERQLPNPHPNRKGCRVIGV